MQTFFEIVFLTTYMGLLSAIAFFIISKHAGNAVIVQINAPPTTSAEPEPEEEENSAEPEETEEQNNTETEVDNEDD